MNEKYSGKKTNKLLQDLGNESWLKYLNRIRNNLIHRKLSEIATYTEDLKLCLPSDPEGEITEKSYSRDGEAAFSYLFLFVFSFFLGCLR